MRLLPVALVALLALAPSGLGHDGESHPIVPCTKGNCVNDADISHGSGDCDAPTPSYWRLRGVDVTHESELLERRLVAYAYEYCYAFYDSANVLHKGTGTMAGVLNRAMVVWGDHEFPHECLVAAHLGVTAAVPCPAGPPPSLLL